MKNPDLQDGAARLFRRVPFYISDPTEAVKSGVDPRSE